MFSFFKKNTEASVPTAFAQSLLVDMHSHILPGIDDGAADVEASVSLITTLVSKGYNKLICTPHIFKELYPNTPETIRNAYNTLLPVVRSTFPNLELGYAAEYYMDDFFDKMLLNNEPLLTIKDNWVLVEHSFMQPPPNLKEKLFNLQMAGYTPILAHPERYEFYAKNLKAYDELYDVGCIFQLNVLSLSGYYGKVAQELAKHLIEKKYVRLLGTDIHHNRHQQAYEHFGNNKLLQQLLQQGKLLNATL